MVSETVQAAQRLLAERERVGLAKYGTTVDRTDLQAGDWLQHAIEEASDLLLYLIRLQQTIPVTAREAEAEIQRVGDKAYRLTGSAAEQAARALGVTPPSKLRDEAERAAYLARWVNAPAEATHLSEDYDGECRWWRSEGAEFGGGPPVMSDGQWFEWSGCNHLAVAGHNILGRVACEPRPEVQS
jgi:hypothetical protein